MIQQSTLDFIKQFEGLSLKPYRDSGGKWSIGYGATYDLSGKPITANTPWITLDEANELLKKQLVSYAAVVEPLNLNQNQFDACTSLCYNIGVGGFKSSKVYKQINLGNYTLAADAILLWNKVNGKVVQGLVNRRKKERELFLTPVKSTSVSNTMIKSKHMKTKTIKLVKTSGFDENKQITSTGQTAEVEVKTFFEKPANWVAILMLLGSFIAGLQGIFPELSWATSLGLVIQILINSFETIIPKSSIVK